MDHTHDSEQLELDLFPGEPWHGRSPRGLTRARLGLIFKPQGVRPRGFSRDHMQLEIWPVTSKAARRKMPQEAPGASTLLPLPLKGSRVPRDPFAERTPGGV